MGLSAVVARRRSVVASWFLRALALLSIMVAARAALAAPEGPATEALAPDAAPTHGRSCSGLCYVHTHLDLGMGKGLRFNNPYRLQQQLGSDARSLSATATTFDARVGALFGDPLGWHYGAALGLSASLSGVPQQVITPALELAYPLSGYAWARGYLGPGIVTQPDTNVGVEGGLQLVGLLRAGLGAFVTLGYAQYWGAATDQSSATSVPIAFGQVGITLRYEVLQ